MFAPEDYLEWSKRNQTDEQRAPFIFPINPFTFNVMEVIIEQRAKPPQELLRENIQKEWNW